VFINSSKNGDGVKQRRQQTKINQQISLQDVNDEYRQFVEKFKPKKTTDDCYTPPEVYDVVKEWVCQEYDIDPETIVRPFWPGASYENYEYPDGCTVLDNPPFSIISKICRDYVRHEIRFFLFAPYLTNFSTAGSIPGVSHIVTDATIIYENGASVNTAFLTNLDEWKVRTAPDLCRAINRKVAELRAKETKQLPKYDYPDNVITSTKCGYLSKYGEDFRVRPEECYFIRSLDAQKPTGKAIFGGGFLISEKAAAEKAAAEKAAAEKAAAEKAAATKWKLSDQEQKIVWSLNPYQE